MYKHQTTDNTDHDYAENIYNDNDNTMHNLILIFLNKSGIWSHSIKTAFSLQQFLWSAKLNHSACFKNDDPKK